MDPDIENRPYVSARDVVRHWILSEIGPVFLVVEDVRRLPANNVWPVLEAGYERYDHEGVLAMLECEETSDGTTEMDVDGVVRVFTTYEEACLYLDLLAESRMPEQPLLKVEKMTLKQLLDLRENLKNVSKNRDHSGFSIDLCHMPTDDWPIRVDTLWASDQQYN